MPAQNPDMQMKIPIVFSTDHNFVTPTCVTILSLLKTSLPQTEFIINIIASPDIDEADRDIIKKQIEISGKKSELYFVDIGKVFSSGYETRGISTACYSRLLIPWLFPQYDKVIYSDVDVIFKGDISEVYNVDLENNLVAGVTGEVWNRGLIKKYLEGLNLVPENYVNSGFLLINSKLQRERNLNERYMELVKNNYVYQDQDIINIACKGYIFHLPAAFNVKPSLAYTSCHEVKMIHYIGLKPWTYFTYCWDDWWEVCKESVVFSPEDYKKLSSQILNISFRYKILKKQITENIKFRLKLFKR